MARRWKQGAGKLVLWDGDGDTLPFDDPLGHADRVKFSTTFGYSRIIDKRMLNVTFPQANGAGERSGTINLFPHGQPGMPRVRGNLTLGGQKISLGCHIPIQSYTGAGGGIANPSNIRLAILGATTTNVVVCWYAQLSNMPANYYLQQITIPMTIEVFNELN